MLGGEGRKERESGRRREEGEKKLVEIIQILFRIIYFGYYIFYRQK